MPRRRMLSRTCDMYALLDPDSEEVRYVGRSVNAHQRYFQHIAKAKSDKRQNYCMTWIRSLLRQERKPLLVLLQTVPLVEWAECERFWISYFTRLGYQLTNANDGGYGPWQISESTRARISAAAKGNRGRTGQPLTIEERQRLSHVHKTRLALQTPEQRRARVSAALAGRRPGWNTGWHHSPESKAKIGAANAQKH